MQLITEGRPSKRERTRTKWLRPTRPLPIIDGRNSKQVNNGIMKSMGLEKRIPTKILASHLSMI